MDGRCMHDGVPADGEHAPGTRVEGIVVCVHVFGVGVYLPALDDFGHVNVPELVDHPVRELSDYPGVGARLDLVVYGRTGSPGQLRLGRWRPQSALGIAAPEVQTTAGQDQTTSRADPTRAFELDKALSPGQHLSSGEGRAGEARKGG